MQIMLDLRHLEGRILELGDSQGRYPLIFLTRRKETNEMAFLNIEQPFDPVESRIFEVDV